MIYSVAYIQMIKRDMYRSFFRLQVLHRLPDEMHVFKKVDYNLIA